ncbi:hypothetical protein T02_15357 [Trichinella nativa]|uniref:Uncharacterized protein n=1 Tax=Trichinella nativa TaxID=6335 RepID=A0A0V1KZC4_9BILA|nr:hypothetical protein T02_15357 [Trichinella nativa]
MEVVMLVGCKDFTFHFILTYFTVRDDERRREILGIRRCTPPSIELEGNLHRWRHLATQPSLHNGKTGRPRRSRRLAWASIQKTKFSAKVDVSEINGQRVDQHRRFAIVRQFVNPELGVCKFCRPFKPHSKPPNKPSSANAFSS